MLTGPSAVLSGAGVLTGRGEVAFRTLEGGSSMLLRDGTALMLLITRPLERSELGVVSSSPLATGAPPNACHA